MNVRKTGNKVKLDSRDWGWVAIKHWNGDWCWYCISTHSGRSCRFMDLFDICTDSLSSPLCISKIIC